jgi:hypothetical protein
VVWVLERDQRQNDGVGVELCAIYDIAGQESDGAFLALGIGAVEDDIVGLA